jgi:hypothetical protein
VVSARGLFYCIGVVVDVATRPCEVSSFTNETTSYDMAGGASEVLSTLGIGDTIILIVFILQYSKRLLNPQETYVH